MAVMTLSDKLDQLGTRYDELTQQLSTAEVASDSARFQKIAKQHAELEEIVAKHREFKQIEKDLAGAHQMVLENEDAEMKQMALDEEKQLTARKEIVERELKLLLLAERSERREERHCGNSRRNGRRRGRPLCWRTFPHVFALCGSARLES